MTGNTVFVVYGHVFLGGAVIEAHELEYEPPVLFQVARAAVLFVLNMLGVRVMKELHGRHLFAARQGRKIDHQNIRPHVSKTCFAVNVCDREKCTRQHNGWNDAFPPWKRSSICHVIFLWFNFVMLQPE
jgi:hypothetical protein